jgi:hypothetical protein
LQDDPQDTGYLILSLTETMEESRRLRQELKSGVKAERRDAGAEDEGLPGTESPGSILP